MKCLNIWTYQLGTCTHSVNYFHYILPLRKRMTEGCKRKGMHKSMLCQLHVCSRISPEPGKFLGSFPFLEQFYCQLYLLPNQKLWAQWLNKTCFITCVFIYIIYRFFSISLDKTSRYCVPYYKQQKQKYKRILPLSFSDSDSE